MAHETQTPDGQRRTLTIQNGQPARSNTTECRGDDCERPTSHPSGECSLCRTE